jgi:hypothetical protein
MATVKQLTLAELRDFKRRFAAWQQASSEQAEEDAVAVEACRARLSAADERRLSAADERRLKALIGKSERGVLRGKELEEYRSLVRRAEKLDATRLAALAQLVSRWGKSVREVMEIVGWEGGDEEATRHPASPPKARPRPRR